MPPVAVRRRSEIVRCPLCPAPTGDRLWQAIAGGEVLRPIQSL